MIKAWILITYLTNPLFPDASGALSQEFTNERACRNAIKKMERMVGNLEMPYKENGRRSWAVCVPKDM